MTKTSHRILLNHAQNMPEVATGSIALVITSPPYPMIPMWDKMMTEQIPALKEALQAENGSLAFDLMHAELDKIWQEVERVVMPGGIVCINIGDAVRTLNDMFALYPNHTRITSAFLKLGFTNLPNIIWRKQTNAPNKFMGSGMLPPGAYVTLEHEWILIFRKGDRRIFGTDAEKRNRRESALFWEERNLWFSDLWSDIKGIRQQATGSSTRERSGAYPFEVPYRLIHMFSVKHDTILDPFLGTGTTLQAAIASERNSIGIDIDSGLLSAIPGNISGASLAMLNDKIRDRIRRHEDFISKRLLDTAKGRMKYCNFNIGAPVMTTQETDIGLRQIEHIAWKTPFDCEVNYGLLSFIEEQGLQPAFL